MTNGTHAAQGKHLESTAAAAKRYVLKEILDVTEAVAAELNGINDVEFIEGTQSASTNAWTGVTKDSALYKGKFIIYKLPYAGTSNATLNLTLAGGKTTGAKNIYRYASTRLKTEYGANYYIPLIYNGTYWFALADFGSTTNYYDRTRIANAVATASGAVQAVCFVGTTDGTHYKELSAGTTFNVNYPVLYNATAVADGAAMSTGLYFAVPSVNLQTVLGDEERTFAEKVPIYLKGTLSGSTFAVHSDILTTTAPTTDDGYLYLRVGFTYSTYQVYVMLFENNFFAYKNGAFQEVNLLALKSLSDIRGQQIDTTYIKGITASDGTLTLTKGDNTSSTVSCGASGSALSTVPATVDGGLWYELENSAPIVKFYYGSQTFTLNLDPNLTVTPAGVLVPINGTLTAAVIYAGSGAVSVSSDNSQITPAYSNGVISVPYVEGAGSANITVAVAASQGCSAASKTFSVTMAQDPQFSVTPSSSNIYAYKSSEGIYYFSSPSFKMNHASHLGDGEVVMTSTDSTYYRKDISSGMLITSPDVTENPATVTFTLAESPPYSAASISYRLQRVNELPDNLIITPSATVSSGDDITATIEFEYDCTSNDYDSYYEYNNMGFGILVTSNNSNVTPTYNANTHTITVPYVAGAGSVTITVQPHNNGTVGTPQSFTVTMEAAQNLNPNLTLSPAYQTVSADTTAYIDVSYLGNGSITVQSSTYDLSPTYDASTKKISVGITSRWVGYYMDATITVNLSASGSYIAASASCALHPDDGNHGTGNDVVGPDGPSVDPGVT